MDRGIAALIAAAFAVAMTVRPALADASGGGIQPARFLAQIHCSTAGALPGDPGCGPLVPLRDGEEPGYRLSNGAHGPGRIDTINLAVTRNGKWRVVSPDAHVQATDAAHDGGVSVEGIGLHYLSILGSWSPMAMSFFVSDECDRDPQGSDRFTAA